MLSEREFESVTKLRAMLRAESDRLHEAGERDYVSALWDDFTGIIDRQLLCPADVLPFPQPRPSLAQGPSVTPAGAPRSVLPLFATEPAR